MYGLPLPQPQIGDVSGDSHEHEGPRHKRREERRIACWRYRQARLVGLEPLLARLFAESDADVEQLRVLVRRRGCEPELALRIVL
jgi:hypothetical protein